MTDITTSSDKPTTISERELFSAFANIVVERRTTFSSAASTPNEIYRPVDYIVDEGQHGQLTFVRDLFDDLSAAGSPEDELDVIVHDLEGYLANLRIVLDDFRSYKQLHARTPDGSVPDDPEARRAWEAEWDEYERNPRFRDPGDGVDFIETGDHPVA